LVAQSAGEVRSLKRRGRQTNRLLPSSATPCGSTYWGNATPYLIRHPGFTDDGSVQRPDGAKAFVRHVGFTDDMTLNVSGSPILFYDAGAYKTFGRVQAKGDTTTYVTSSTFPVAGYLELNTVAADQSIHIRECSASFYPFP
jgi:hypothetical protein